MARDYTLIACQIGKGILEQVKLVGREPLPEPLAALLDALETAEACEPRNLRADATFKRKVPRRLPRVVAIDRKSLNPA